MKVDKQTLLKVFLTIIMCPLIFAPTYIIVKIAYLVGDLPPQTPIWWMNVALLLCVIHSMPVINEWPIEEIWGNNDTETLTLTMSNGKKIEES